jgi:prepilin-type N-terminal cleavage/methylation domain-containing protein
MNNATRRRHPWSAQAGFTLVELMVAMGLAVLVLGFIFAIHFQTSTSLRAYVKLGTHYDQLVAARNLIATNVRSAGRHLPPRGLKIAAARDTGNLVGFVNCEPRTVASLFVGDCALAGTSRVLPAVGVRNGGPTSTIEAQDELFILRGQEAGARATRTGNVLTFLPADIARVTTADGLLALVSIDRSAGCLVGVTPGPSANDLSIVAADQPFATSHCPLGPSVDGVVVNVDWFSLGAGDELRHAKTWSELLASQGETVGVGFTNLQFAMRFFETSDGVACATCDVDGDGDVKRDWYAANQRPIALNNDLTNLRPTGASHSRPADGYPIAVGITVEHRTGEIRLVKTEATEPLGQFRASGPGSNFHHHHGDFWMTGCPASGPNPCGVNLITSTNPHYVPGLNLDPDNNAVNDGLHFIFGATTSVVSLRSAGGAM